MIVTCMAGMSVTAFAASAPLAVGTTYNIGDTIQVSNVVYADLDD